MNECMSIQDIESDIFNKKSKKKQIYGRFKMNRGEDRYIYIPIDNKRIVAKSFELYSTLSRIRKLYVNLLVKLIYFINPKFIYEDILYLDLNENIKLILDNVGPWKYVSLYTGDGYKYVLQVMDKDAKILGYMKIYNSKDAIKEMVKEINGSKKALELGFDNIPNIVYEDREKGIFVQDTGLNITPFVLNLNIIDFLNRSLQKTWKRELLRNSVWFKHIEYLGKYYNDKEGSELFTKTLRMLLENKEIEYIYTCFSHGDFTLKNMKSKNNSIYIYDWEFADIRPIYYDIFFFFVILGMENKLSSEKIINSIFNNKYIEKYELDNDISISLRKPMFIIFLCELIYFHIGDDIDNKIHNRNSLKALNILKTLI